MSRRRLASKPTPPDDDAADVEHADEDDDGEPADAAKVENRDQPGSLPSEVEDQLYDVLDSTTMDRAGDTLNSIQEAAISGQELQMAEVAETLGIEPQQAEGALNNIRAAFQTQADDAVRTLGIDDVEAFYDWARTERSQDLRHAILNQIERKSLEGYDSLANAYLKSNPNASHAEDYLGADHGEGIDVFEQGGKVMIRVEGRMMEVQRAIKLGLVVHR